MAKSSSNSLAVRRKTPLSNDSCHLYDKVVGKNVKALQCDTCDRWVHLRCDADVSQEAFKGLSDNPSPAIFYLCPPCRKPWGLIQKRLSGMSISTYTQTSHNTCDKSVSTKLGVPEKKKIKHAGKAHKNGKSTAHKPNNHNTETENDSKGKTKRLKPFDTNTVEPKTLPHGEVTVISKHSGNRKKRSSTLHNDSRMVHKAVGTPTVGNNLTRRLNSVIVFNAPESSSVLLHERDTHDRSLWTSISRLLNVTSEVTQIRRLSRMSQSGSLRPMRVEVSDSKLAEQILLTSGLLRGSEFDGIKIKADLTKIERDAIKVTRHDHSAQIVIRGIPETENSSSPTGDYQQWSYISRLLQRPQLFARELVRLPRPTHLAQIQEPRLMRITLVSPDVASDILGCWKDVKPSLPPGITIHGCRTRKQRQNFNPKSPILSIPAVTISPILDEEITGNIPVAPKNF